MIFNDWNSNRIIKYSNIDILCSYYSFHTANRTLALFEIYCCNESFSNLFTFLTDNKKIVLSREEHSTDPVSLSLALLEE